MRLVLTGRHVDVPPGLRAIAEEKLTKLERVLSEGIVSVQIVLALERHRHVVEVTVHARGDRMLHALGDATAWETSLGEAIEKVEGQLQKVKGRWNGRKRRARSVREVPPPAGEAATADDTTPRRVVRTERYAVKPMTVEEAALTVDAARGTFVVFRNASTDAIAVLYRRKDGHLGLIEPEN